MCLCVLVQQEQTCSIYCSAIVCLYNVRTRSPAGLGIVWTRSQVEQLAQLLDKSREAFSSQRSLFLYLYFTQNPRETVNYSGMTKNILEQTLWS